MFVIQYRVTTDKLSVAHNNYSCLVVAYKVMDKTEPEPEL